MARDGEARRERGNNEGRKRGKYTEKLVYERATDRSRKKYDNDK